MNSFRAHFWLWKHHQIRFNEGGQSASPFTNKLWQIMRPKIKFDSYVNPGQQEAAVKECSFSFFIHPIQVPGSRQARQPGSPAAVNWPSNLHNLRRIRAEKEGKVRWGPCGIINSQRYLFVMRTRGCPPKEMLRHSANGLHGVVYSDLDFELGQGPRVFVRLERNNICSMGKVLGLTMTGRNRGPTDHPTDRPTTELCQR